MSSGRSGRLRWTHCTRRMTACVTTTHTYLNAMTQLLHELNERTPLTLVKG
jgi:hypothetical protein